MRLYLQKGCSLHLGLKGAYSSVINMSGGRLLTDGETESSANSNSIGRTGSGDESEGQLDPGGTDGPMVALELAVDESTGLSVDCKKTADTFASDDLTATMVRSSTEGLGSSTESVDADLLLSTGERIVRPEDNDGGNPNAFTEDSDRNNRADGSGDLVSHGTSAGILESNNSSNNSNRSWRVKLYQLREEDGQWADKGTGNVELELPDSVEMPPRVTVTNESKPFNILYTGGVPCDAYQRQGDTIITWSEDSVEMSSSLTNTIDLALSFQEPEGCLEIWDALQVRARNLASTHDGNYGPTSTFSGSDGEGVVRADTNVSTIPPPAEMLNVKPTVNSLPAILDYLNIVPAQSYSTLGKFFVDSNPSYIYELLNIFAALEDSMLKKMNKIDEDSGNNGEPPGDWPRANSDNHEALSEPDIDSFHRLFHIFRLLVGLNHKELLEMFIDDKCWMRFVGVLEYNPNAAPMTIYGKVRHILGEGGRRTGEIKYTYRSFLSSTVRYKQVGPIQNRAIVNKIHQNFRLSYLQSSIHGIIFEDTPGILTNMEMICKNEIVRMMSDDKVFIAGLFASLGCSEGQEEVNRMNKQIPPVKLVFPEHQPSREDTLKCLKELCNLTHAMQNKLFYRALYAEGGVTEGGATLFGALSVILADKDANIVERSLATEILHCCVSNDQVTFRSHVCSKGQHPKSPTQPILEDSKGERSDRNSSRAKVAETLGPNHVGTDVGGGTSRTFLACSKDGTLLHRICARLIGDDEECVQLQCFHILKELLDPDNMDPKEKEEFIAIFYDHYVPWLVHALDRCPGPWKPSYGFTQSDSTAKIDSRWSLNGVGFGALPRFKELDMLSRSSIASIESFPGDLGRSLHQASEAARSSWVHVVELLSFCVERHQYRFKSFMKNNNVLVKVVRLLNCREKYVKLTAVQFVRKCVSLRDDDYNSHIVKNKVLLPIFQLFCENGPRDNLINSSIIEMIKFILSEKLNVLLDHILLEFHSGSVTRGPISFDFNEVTYVDTFQNVLKDYEQRHGSSYIGGDSIDSEASSTRGVSTQDSSNNSLEVSIHDDELVAAYPFKDSLLQFSPAEFEPSDAIVKKRSEDQMDGKLDAEDDHKEKRFRFSADEEYIADATNGQDEDLLIE